MNAGTGIDETPRTQRRRAVVASVVGTTIEWYDFFLYGTTAALIFPAVFFPHSSESTAILESFATLFVGFAARPAGAALFGHSYGAVVALETAVERTDLAALGVGAVGLDESARSIPVDERMRAADGVWAIGDVTGHGAFTHTSVYQSPIAVADILGQESAPADYRAVPAVTFTDPEVATVGHTEKSASQQGIRVRTGSTEIPSSPRGWIHKAGNAGLIKLVADADRGVLVGATVAAPSGGEVVGALAVAVHAEVPVAQLQRMIYGYPTFHRAISAALEDLG